MIGMLTSPQAPDVAEQMARRARWTSLEIAFWLVAFSTIYFLPGRHLILTEIAIWALFALSLDLILGYGGIVVFVLFLLARRIVNSPFGLSLPAVRGNPLRASAIGIPVDWRLVAIYTIAAGYAGIAGGLLAQTTAFASLEVFSFDRSAD